MKLNEGKNVGVLYHFTDLTKIFTILHSDRLRPSSLAPHERWPDNYEEVGPEYKQFKHPQLQFVSTTRNKDFNKISRLIGHPLNFAIILDGNKLSDKYKIKAYEYPFNNAETKEFFNSYKDFDMKNKKEIQHTYWDKPDGITNEQEERVYTNSAGITDLNEYILGFIVINENDKKIVQKAAEKNLMGHLPIYIQKGVKLTEAVSPNSVMSIINRHLDIALKYIIMNGVTRDGDDLGSYCNLVDFAPNAIMDVFKPKVTNNPDAKEILNNLSIALFDNVVPYNWHSLSDYISEARRLVQISSEDEDKIFDVILKQMHESWMTHIYPEFEQAILDGTIYRAVNIPIYRLRNFEKRLRNGSLGWYEGIGIYWSFNKSGAGTYWYGVGPVNGNKRKFYSSTDTVIFLASFKTYEVNWPNTIDKALGNNYSQEYEIELKEDARIEVIGYYITDHAGTNRSFNHLEIFDKPIAAKASSDKMRTNYRFAEDINANR